MTTELTGSEKFWYYLACVCTFGGLYFAKLAAKKAMTELNAASVAHAYNRGAPLGPVAAWSEARRSSPEDQAAP